MEDRLGVSPHRGDLTGFRIARRPESHDDAGTSGRLRPRPQTDLLRTRIAPVRTDRGDQHHHEEGKGAVTLRTLGLAATRSALQHL